MSMPLRLVVPLIMLAMGQMGCRRSEGTVYRKHIADFNAVAAAIKTYKINAGELPPPELGLQALLERPHSLPPEKNWEQIMKKIPLDAWNNPYRYLAGEGLQDGFGLYSCGPDGITSSAGNDPDDLNTWSDSSPADSRWENWKLLALAAGAVVAAGSFLLGYRVAMKEARRDLVG